MKNLHFYCLIWLFTLLSFGACSFAFDDIETKGALTPELAVPLLETQLRLDKLMEGLGSSSYLQVGNDGTFVMQYRGTFAESPTFNVLETLPQSIVIPFDKPVIIVPFPSPTGMKIDSMAFKKGIFRWRVSNPYTFDLNVKITAYELTNTEGVFQTTFLLPANLSDVGGEIDLKGWNLKSTAGKMSLECQATARNVNFPIYGNYEYAGLVAQRTIGYFGQKTLSLSPQSLNLDFFKKWNQQGEVRFLQPKLTITLDNSIGVPISAKARLAEVIKTNGSKLAFDSPLTTGIDLAYPSLREIGLSKSKTVVINSSNSNIVNVLNEYPTVLTFAVDAFLNPDTTNKTSGHITDVAKVKFKMDMDIPLIATAKNFVVFDTLDMDLSKFKQITAAEFRIVTDNSLPIDMGLQAYFLTAGNGLIDSLVTSSPSLILKSAPTFNGTVVGVTSNIALINVDAAKFEKLRSTRKIIVKYILSTTSNGSVPVTLKADQKFSLRIGLKTGIKI